MKIVDDKNIYPNELVPVLEHYKEYFDVVKICFLPFFKLNSDSDITSKKSSKQISFEELKSKYELFKNISTPNAEIYVPNENYPQKNEIVNSGQIVNWTEIVSKTELENYRQTNQALKTSIGAYKKPLRRFDLYSKLEKYTKANKIWHPNEGQFDIFTKMSIYKLLKKLKKNKVIVISEYYDETKELNIENISKVEFVDAIKFKDYYIFSKDESVLFAISWDDFFFLIATKKENLKVINEVTKIEGFIANENDSHLWDWEEGEIEKILNAAAKSNKKS